MVVLGYKISGWFFHRMKNGDIIVGVKAYKDWNHTFGFDFRYSLKLPHLMFCREYTTETEYVTVFDVFGSKAYRSKHGGLTFYRHDEYRQDVNEGRCGCC
jgi:hypothetical protein